MTLFFFAFLNKNRLFKFVKACKDQSSPRGLPWRDMDIIFKTCGCDHFYRPLLELIMNSINWNSVLFILILNYILEVLYCLENIFYSKLRFFFYYQNIIIFRLLVLHSEKWLYDIDFYTIRMTGNRGNRSNVNVMAKLCR